MCEFIAVHKTRFPIAAICRALSAHGIRIAPRTFHAWVVRAPSRRALWDTAVTEILAGYYEPDQNGKRQPECLYGAEKMWAYLHRLDIPVARCTIERLMLEHGLEGVRRGAKSRITVPDEIAPRPPDLVNRRFVADQPDQLRLADITYVRTWEGWVYVAFVLDVFSRRIVGWQLADHLRTDLRLDALEMALWQRNRDRPPSARRPGGGLIHHSDRGC